MITRHFVIYNWCPCWCALLIWTALYTTPCWREAYSYSVKSMLWISRFSTHLQCSDFCDHLSHLNWQHLNRHNWVDTVLCVCVCVCGDLRAWLVPAGSESGAGHTARGKKPGHSILRWFYMSVGHFPLFTCRWQKGQRISVICATLGVETEHILWPYSHTPLPNTFLLTIIRFTYFPLMST